METLLRKNFLLCLRWYLRYGLSYKKLEEIMMERGLGVDHTTIYRWVIIYAPETEKRSRKYLKPTNDSWHVDETKVKGKWKYLYRAIDRVVLQKLELIEIVSSLSIKLS